MSLLIRRSFWESFGLVVVAVAPWVLAFWLFEAAPAAASRGLQWLGIGILLWATLSLLGSELPDGQTLAEKVNRWLYRGLYLIGTALLACSVSWPTAAILG